MPPAISTACSVPLISPTKPGTTETPAALARRFDSILSPIAAMAGAGGPMKAIPAALSASTKDARSDRKP